MVFRVIVLWAVTFNKYFFNDSYIQAIKLNYSSFLTRYRTSAMFVYIIDLNRPYANMAAAN